MISFIFIFSAIFLPKISFFDTSIVAIFSISAVYILIYGKKTIYFDKNLFYVFIILSIYFIYILFVQMAHGVPSVELIGRTFRSWSFLLLLCISSKIIIDNDGNTLKYILYCLSIHALLLIVSANYLPLNIFFGEVFGNDRVRNLRSSGLVSGFDMAGLFCAIGLLIIATRAVRFKSIFLTFFFVFLFTAASYYSSRVSMVLCILIFMYASFELLVKDKSYSSLKRLVIFAAIFSFFVYIFSKIAIIFEVALNLGLFSVEGDEAQMVAERFSSATVDEAASGYSLFDMYFIPSTDMKLLFGDGTDQPYSDVGYIKFLFWNGVIGLLIIYILHIYLIIKTFINMKYSNVNYKVLIFALYFMIFVLTLKNNYLLTRGIFPLILIVYLHSIWVSENSRARLR